MNINSSLKNILILSCGTRNKVIQAFRDLPQVHKVYCTDSSSYAPALYEGDEAIHVPKMTESNYLEIILNICREKKIDGVLSLIDPELSLLAEYKDQFLEIGTIPMISDLEAVQNCFDKNQFSKVLQENGINTIQSADSIDKAKKKLKQGILTFPLMVKPAQGSASIGLNKVQSIDQLEQFLKYGDDLIIQEWIEMQEYGVDCYIDMIGGHLVEMFIKEKIKMRAGETDKAISRHNILIKRTILDFLEKYPYRFKGTIDFDVFCDQEHCLISEINPRFGGGYPHAYACGLNYPKFFLNNLQGIENPNFYDFVYEEGIVMMKYNEVMIRKLDELVN